MPVPQQNWRPSDADRERYSTILSDAFTVGRIDATGLSERNSALYAATSVGELDALVGDLPRPPGARPPRQASPVTRRLVGTIVAVATAVVVGYVVSPEEAEPEPPVTVAEEQPLAPEAEVPPADPAPAPDLPPIATVKQNMFTAEALAELWATMPATGVAEIWDLTLYADRASLVVRSPADPNHLANVDYEAGLPFPEALNRKVNEYDAFFGWDDVTPEAVATAIAATPAAGGEPDSQVSHVMVEGSHHRDLTIRVYQEGEAPSVIWAADGTEMLDVL